MTTEVLGEEGQTDRPLRPARGAPRRGQLVAEFPAPTAIGGGPK